jgi:hypothetical protein
VDLIGCLGRKSERRRQHKRHERPKNETHGG